jgi:hypothetical protein
MENLINNILKKICLKSCSHTQSDLSLYGGVAGEALFLCYYIEYIAKNEIIEEAFEKKTIFLAENNVNITNDTFCNGKVGVSWLFSFLHKKNIIYTEDKKILCDDIYIDVKKASLKMLEEGNYDFLHGSIGLFYYLLYNSAEKSFIDDCYYENYIGQLEKLQVDSKYGIYVPNKFFSKDEIEKYSINLGLSHGIPSIVKVLLEVFKKGVAKELTKTIAFNLIDCMLSCMNIDTSVSYFPSAIDISSKQTSSPSRLAWCYGDLGVAYVIYQAGETFEDNYLKNLAIEILEASTKRKDVKDTKLFDFGLCHGVAGVTHIYYKVWQITKLPVFKRANEYWLSQLLLPAADNNFVPYYEKYYPPNRTFMKSHSFLEGAVGIAMVLLSYTTENTDWDYCLMLNE